jgi:hypothetical protein
MPTVDQHPGVFRDRRHLSSHRRSRRPARPGSGGSGCHAREGVGIEAIANFDRLDPLAADREGVFVLSATGRVPAGREAPTGTSGEQACGSSISIAFLHIACRIRDDEVKSMPFSPYMASIYLNIRDYLLQFSLTIRSNLL